VTSLIVAIPATLILGYAADRVRARDLEVALERVIRSQINDQVRERCDSDPTWFLTGPLVGRPAGGVFVPAYPDQLEPRPRVEPQPFELFGYDEQFIGSSSATPQLPRDFRLLLRGRAAPLVAPYFTPEGTGVQMAIGTGWNGSKCNYLLGRMAPPPHQARQRILTLAAIFVSVAAMAMLAAVPTIGRIRKLARHARESVAGGYTSIAPEALKDELSSLTFVFNDAMNELALRKTRIDDQAAELRRLLQSTETDVAAPLADLESRLAELELAGTPEGSATRAVFLQAHDLRAEAENLTAVSRLRLIGASPESSRLDLAALVRDVATRHAAFAHAKNVSLAVQGADAAVAIDADSPLLSCALSNLVDNAIRYNRPGGSVMLTLVRAEDGRRFRLHVTDNGPGVDETHFRGLTAVRRFRGDEGRSRRPGAPGLGLAVAQEVADRFKLKLDLKRPAAGGFEVELSGPMSA
jgi:signal transduction histidine kinase